MCYDLVLMIWPIMRSDKGTWSHIGMVFLYKKRIDQKVLCALCHLYDCRRWNASGTVWQGRWPIVLFLRFVSIIYKVHLNGDNLNLALLKSSRTFQNQFFLEISSSRTPRDLTKLSSFLIVLDLYFSAYFCRYIPVL